MSMILISISEKVYLNNDTGDDNHIGTIIKIGYAKNHFQSLTEDFFFPLLLLERGEGRQKERERTIHVREKHHWLPLIRIPNGDGTNNRGTNISIWKLFLWE